MKLYECYEFSPPDDSWEVLYFTAELVCHPVSVLQDGSIAQSKVNINGNGITYLTPLDVHPELLFFIILKGAQCIICP